MKRWFVGGLLVLDVACFAFTQAGQAPGRVIDPVDEAEVETSFVAEGESYKLYRGGIYRVDQRSGKWVFMKQGYDPDYYKKNYVERTGKVFRKGPDGKLYSVKRHFVENFEGAKTIRQLINIKRGWTSMSLLSPIAPTVMDYVRLRARILKGNSDFQDNRVAPTSEIVHGGQGALKTYSVAKSSRMTTAKASLDTELMHFVKGDDVWFSGWYFIPRDSGMPTTVMDLETTWFYQHPGIRIIITGGRYAEVELKWGAKPTYRQPRGRQIDFPKAQWVHLMFHVTLSEKHDGIVQLWQNGKKLIDTHGQTLPLSHSIYNSLEIGLTAYSRGPRPATLYVDDIEISDQRMD